MKCFSNPGYFVPLPPGHPFPVEKYPETHGALVALGRRELEFCLTTPVDMTAVLAVHREEYLEAIRANQLTKYARNRLGLPSHPRWLERSLLDVGGTLQAAEAALEERVAWNLGGGTHHAMAGEGLGFCVLNDVAVATREMLRRHSGLRILILDTDAHQGNGTHCILRGQPGAFTFSIHVGANYPAAKEPGDLDVPLERYVDGACYLEALKSGLAEVEQRFHPDLVFWVSGVDVLEGDRFGQMRLSAEDFKARDRMVLEAVSGWGACLVGTLAGGYPERRDRLADLHAASVLNTLEVFS